VLDAKDYITRGDALFDQSLPVFKHYDREVKRILHRAWERDVIVRAVHLPPFDPEWIVGVTRAQNGYRAFLLEASYFIWQAMNDEKEKLPSIHGIYHERPLDEAAALRIAALWRAVLSAPQNYRKDPTMYGDSSTFHFFVGAVPHEHLAGHTSHVFDHAQAEVLTIVAGKLYDYATRKPASEAKLQQEIRRAERQLGVQPRSASNQAMQLTAPRSVFPLSVATPFNLQPRPLPGAVADLVSR
jgi:hypothetical protein